MIVQSSTTLNVILANDFQFGLKLDPGQTQYKGVIFFFGFLFDRGWTHSTIDEYMLFK